MRFARIVRHRIASAIIRVVRWVLPYSRVRRIWWREIQDGHEQWASR